MHISIYGKNDSFPLLATGETVRAALNSELGADYEVFLAMRYQQPSIEKVLHKIQHGNFSSLRVVPLFPQYASATTGSVIQEVMRIVQKWKFIPRISFVDKFYDHPLLSKAFADVATSLPQFNYYDVYLFSYHGIPITQLPHGTRKHSCHDGTCQECLHVSEHNRYCYRAQCKRTTDLISKELSLQKNKVITSFQSRLGRERWTAPYTSDVIHTLGKMGKKKILVFSPSFICDCLETTVEINIEYKKMFKCDYGGELRLVPSLNSHPRWIELLSNVSRDEGYPSSNGRALTEVKDYPGRMSGTDLMDTINLHKIIL
jgi:ferrochelatase